MIKNKFAADNAAMLLNDHQLSTMRRTKFMSGLTPILFIWTMGCMLAFPLMARAQVSLPTVNLGDTNFEDGIAGPGFFAEEFPGYYTASEMKDANGNTVPGQNRVTAISTTTHIAYLSKKHVLGGLYGGEVLLPLVDLDVNLANGPRDRVRGLGDLIVSPFILQWVPKKIGHGIIAQRAVFDIVLPTGKYSDQRPVNIGNHSVTLNPYYAVTYEPNSKLEASLRFHYLWNSENDQPFVGFGFKNIQAGQAVHANYATSYAVRKGVRLGFNGYWLQQITDHKINGKDVPNSRERTIGLGPGLQLGGQGLWFRANSYLETGVQNRMSGIKVTFRLSKAF